MQEDDWGLLRKKLARSRFLVVIANADFDDDSNNKFNDFPSLADWNDSPDDVTSWLIDRQKKALMSGPANLHRLMAGLYCRKKQFVLFTESVDGFYGKAGCRNTFEFRGNIWTARCSVCGIIHEFSELISKSKCRECGRIIRPDIKFRDENFSKSIVPAFFTALSHCDTILILDSNLSKNPLFELPFNRNIRFIAVINSKLPDNMKEYISTFTGDTETILKKVLYSVSIRKHKSKASYGIKTFLEKIKPVAPKNFGDITVYPILTSSHCNTDYCVLHDSVGKHNVLLDEIYHKKNTCNILVNNREKRKVLLLEGERIIGLKRNRVVISSFLVKECSKLVIPVTPVEKNRWEWIGYGHLVKIDIAPPSVKAAIKSDIIPQIKFHGILAPGCKKFSSMLRYYNSKDKEIRDIAEYEKAFSYQPNQIGMMVYINGKFVAMELFGNADIAEKYHKKLIHSFVDEAKVYKSNINDVNITPDDCVTTISKIRWEKFLSCGLGSHYYAESKGFVSSSLLWHGSIIHLSMHQLVS